MPWQLVAPNQWKNDRSDFTIKFDEAYGSYIVESVDGRFSIPFDDIFNNPVFPIDLSQVTVLGKHFRAEGVNTPGTPGFSFQGDANSGMYRISEDRMGFSAGGIKQGEFGIGYGGFTGNIIQVIQSTVSGSATTASTTFQNYNLLAATITPKYNNSKILILLTGTFYASVSAYAQYGGEIGIFSNIASARVALSDYQLDGRTNRLDQVGLAISISYLDSPNTILPITYTPQYRSLHGYVFGFGYGVNSRHSLTLMEVQQ